MTHIPTTLAFAISLWLGTNFIILVEGALK